MEKPRIIVLGIIALMVVVAFTQIDFSAENADRKQQDQPDEMRQTLIEVASDNKQISTLAAAAKTAKLADTLESQQNFTIFAPSEEAFSTLPEGKFAEIVDPDNKERLRQIVSYHVVPGIIKADDLEDGQVLTTLQGNKIRISLKNDSAKVNGAYLVRSDIEATNGVIHVIDDVLMPSSTPQGAPSAMHMQ